MGWSGPGVYTPLRTPVISTAAGGMHPTVMHFVSTRKKLWEGNVSTRVCLSTGVGSAFPQSHWDAPYLGWMHSPLDGCNHPAPPPPRRQTVYRRTVRMLLECILIIYKFYPCNLHRIGQLRVTLLSLTLLLQRTVLLIQSLLFDTRTERCVSCNELRIELVHLIEYFKNKRKSRF